MTRYSLLRGSVIGPLMLLFSSLPAAAQIPKELLHLTVTFRLKGDPDARREGVVDATLSCLNAECDLSETILTGCDTGEPRGFYVFTHSTADDTTKNSFHGFRNRDQRSGWITAEYEVPGLRRTTYRFDYLREGDEFRLTGASKVGVTFKSVVTGRMETYEWVPLTGLMPIVNLGCGFHANGIIPQPVTKPKKGGKS